MEEQSESHFLPMTNGGAYNFFIYLVGILIIGILVVGVGGMFILSTVIFIEVDIAVAIVIQLLVHIHLEAG